MIKKFDFKRYKNIIPYVAVGIITLALYIRRYRAQAVWTDWSFFCPILHMPDWDVYSSVKV